MSHQETSSFVHNSTMSSDSSQEFEHGLPVYGPCPSPLRKNELQELAKPGTVDLGLGDISRPATPPYKNRVRGWFYRFNDDVKVTLLKEFERCPYLDRANKTRLVE